MNKKEIAEELLKIANEFDNKQLFAEATKMTRIAEDILGIDETSDDVMPIYVCGKGHTFTEPGVIRGHWSGDPEKSTPDEPCCPECGSDYSDAFRCSVCGNIYLDKGEAINCDHQRQDEWFGEAKPFSQEEDDNTKFERLREDQILGF